MENTWKLLFALSFVIAGCTSSSSDDDSKSQVSFAIPSSQSIVDAVSKKDGLQTASTDEVEKVRVMISVTDSEQVNQGFCAFDLSDTGTTQSSGGCSFGDGEDTVNSNISVPQADGLLFQVAIMVWLSEADLDDPSDDGSTLIILYDDSLANLSGQETAQLSVAPEVIAISDSGLGIFTGRVLTDNSVGPTGKLQMYLSVGEGKPDMLGAEYDMFAGWVSNLPFLSGIAIDYRINGASLFDGAKTYQDAIEYANGNQKRIVRIDSDEEELSIFHGFIGAYAEQNDYKTCSDPNLRSLSFGTSENICVGFDNDEDSFMTSVYDNRLVMGADDGVYFTEVVGPYGIRVDDGMLLQTDNGKLQWRYLPGVQEAGILGTKIFLLSDIEADEDKVRGVYLGDGKMDCEKLVNRTSETGYQLVGDVGISQSPNNEFEVTNVSPRDPHVVLCPYGANEVYNTSLDNLFSQNDDSGGSNDPYLRLENIWSYDNTNNVTATFGSGTCHAVELKLFQCPEDGCESGSPTPAYTLTNENGALAISFNTGSKFEYYADSTTCSNSTGRLSSTEIAIGASSKSIYLKYNGTLDSSQITDVGVSISSSEIEFDQFDSSHESYFLP